MVNDIGKVPRRRQWWSRIVAAVTAALIAGIVVVAAGEASAATVDVNAWYVLVNRNSGKALDVYGADTSDGARITQWTRTDASNQQFQFVDSGSGYYRLRARHSGKVLDVTTGPPPTGRTSSSGVMVVGRTSSSGSPARPTATFA
jgi:hypothetical protein